jgi:ABC-type antimicrobial peptide transport system permease subunit
MVRQGAAVAMLGIGIGLVAALGLTRLLSGMLFEVSATDPATFVAIASFLGAVALLAAWLPARRAAHVDPIVALRAE